jgi:hypothetical protein
MRYVLFWYAYSPILHIYNIFTNHWLWFRFTVKQVKSVPWYAFILRKNCIKHDEFPSNQRFRELNVYVVRRTDLREDLPMFRMLAIKSQCKNNLDPLSIAFWTCFLSPTPAWLLACHSLCACARIILQDPRFPLQEYPEIPDFLTRGLYRLRSHWSKGQEFCKRFHIVK